MSTQIPRDAAGRVIRPKPSQLLADVMDALGPDHLTTRTLMAALIERDRGAGVEPRAVTPGYGWHLPVLADPPNVPYDMQETALDVEATLAAALKGFAAGSSLAPAPPAVPGEGTVAVTFPAGAFSTPPAIAASVETSAARPGAVYHNSLTATGVNLVWHQTAGPAGSRYITWIAQARSGAAVLAEQRPAEPGTVEVEVTCPTPGCGNQGIPIPILTRPGTPIECGVCGTVLREPTGPASPRPSPAPGGAP